MSVAQFSKAEFEDALTRMSKTGSKLWELDGMDRGEYVYHIPVPFKAPGSKRIMIRSSVKMDGQSADAGKDSIRLWAEIYRDGKWVPLRKLDRWTTRMPGWESRTRNKIRELYILLMNVHIYTKARPSISSTRNPLVNAQKPVQPAPVQATLPVVKPDGFVPSKYQLDIFDEIKNGAGHVMVIAVPGSGKTTVLERGLSYTPRDKAVCMMAFNKHIVEELEARKKRGLIPVHAAVRTLHSQGLKNARDFLKLSRDAVKYNKVYGILRGYAEKAASLDDSQKIRLLIPYVIKLVSLCKGCLVLPTREGIEYLADRYNVDLNGDLDKVVALTQHAFNGSLADLNTVDFDDMIYLSAIGTVPCEKFDYLFVDEAQDLNKAQVEMLLKSLKPGGRAICVGDPHQSIYGFRGADVEAVQHIVDTLKAKVMPLSITYRCPKSHVKLVNEIVPEVEAAPWADDGVIIHTNEPGFLSMVKVGDMCICRCNAPLVKPAFALIRNKVKAVILGRDIGDSLKQTLEKVAKKYAVYSLPDMLRYLKEYTTLEAEKARVTQKEGLASLIEDRCDTIIALADGCQTVLELEENIKNVFSDKSEGVTFSSVHKAKGLEAERVFILKPDLMPLPRVTRDWEVQQEMNIKLVALSRSKRELSFVRL